MQHCLHCFYINTSSLPLRFSSWTSLLQGLTTEKSAGIVNPPMPAAGIGGIERNGTRQLPAKAKVMSQLCIICHQLWGNRVIPKQCLINALPWKWKILQYTLHLSQFMSGAVATRVYRSVQLLGKEGQCSSAVRWSNDYNSMMKIIWKEQVFCNVTKDSSVLGQCCGLTQRSLFIAYAFSEEHELCVSFGTCIWLLSLFKGRQMIESQLGGTLETV